MDTLRPSPGRRRPARGVALRVATALTVAALLTACGGDDDDDADDDATTTEQDAGTEPDSGTAPTDDEAASGDHPCDVVDAAAVEALVGSPIGEGEVRITTVTENDLEWTPDECEWDVEDVIEMDLHLVQADDYTAGEVVCPELGGLGAEVTEVDGLGDSAQWEYSDNDGSAHLRVCTATGMVDAKVEPEDVTTFDSAELQAIATELAEPVLALL